MTTTTLPAGRYYIGDLCYVMDGEWTEVCKLIIDGHNVKSGIFKLADGRTFANFTTKYGDGHYEASNGDELCVDSGSIGCIRVEDITVGDLSHLGTVVDFADPFTVGSNDGEISFGHITVDTDF